MFAGEPNDGHVLVLADDEERAARLTQWVTAAGQRSVVLVGTETLKMEAGEDEAFDLVATDLATDDPAARALLDRLLWGELLRDVPQLHIVRDPDLHRRLVARSAALSDVLIAAPPEPDTFAVRVRLCAEIGRLRREVSRRTTRDPLTGLFNRRYLYHRLDEEFSRARRYRTPLSFAVVDIDRLRAVNAEHGTAAGDALIRAIGALLQSWVRREDVVGRSGDDAFGLVLPGNRFRGAAVLANKVRTEVENLEVHVGRAAIPARVSAGLSTYPDSPDVDSADDVARRAEAALAEAKARGGNRVFIDPAVFEGGRHSVLVVDADPILLDIVEGLLGRDDVAVVTAEGPRQAEDAIGRAVPDLIVVETDTVGGTHAAARLVERLRAEHPERRVPAIAVSRFGGVEPGELKRLGFDKFLTKPFSVSVLRGLARELLEGALSPSGGRHPA